MDDDRLLEELERVAASIGIKIRRTDLKGPEGLAGSGLVILRGEPVIIVHQQLTKAEQIEVLLESMQGFDLESVYLSPACRKALEIRRHSRTLTTERIA
jgi:hypothetical protein